MAVPAPAPVLPVVPAPAHESADAARAAESGLEEEEFALRSLRKHIQKIVDRRSPYGKVYPLDAVLCLVVVALLCIGAKGVSQVVAFAVGQGAQRRYNGPNRRKKTLRDRRKRPPAAKWLFDIGLTWWDEPTVPTVEQMTKILAGVTVKDINQVMSGWVSDLLARLRTGRMVGSVDGKALRAGGRHVLSVFIHDLQQVALHREVEAGKKNELSTFRDGLEEFLDRYPGLWLIVGDALFADQTLCRMLDGRRRYWLFQIKENQPALLEKMRIVFSPITRKKKPDATSEPEKRGTMSSGANCGSPTGATRN